MRASEMKASTPPRTTHRSLALSSPMQRRAAAPARLLLDLDQSTSACERLTDSRIDIAFAGRLTERPGPWLPAARGLYRGRVEAGSGLADCRFRYGSGSTAGVGPERRSERRSGRDDTATHEHINPLSSPATSKVISIDHTLLPTHCTHTLKPPASNQTNGMSLADELGELDPDFAPRQHESNHTLDSSFGSHPANQEEDDEDVDPYARSLDQLGDGFGMGGMGHSLAELDGEEDDQFGNSWGNPVGEGTTEDQPYRTPRRRTASESSRNSLAFELASASKPAAGGSRDLLRELGIEEGDEEEDEGGADGSSEEEEDQFQERLASFGVDGLGTPTMDRRASLQPPPSQRSPPTTPLMQRRGLSSRGSSYSLANDFQFSEVDGEAKAAEVEAAHATVAAEMTDSVLITTSFLATLRSYTTAPDQPLASTSASTRVTTSLLTTPSHSASATAVGSPVEGPLDRQPVVEGLAGGVIKTMYELVREREQQVRELTDFERQVSRQDPGWQAALSQIDDFDDDEDEHVNEADHSTDQNPNLPSPTHDTPIPPANGSSDRSRHHPDLTPPTLPALKSLSDLQTTTASLLSTLSALHESSQVALAAGSESARKIRAMRGQAQAVQDDLVSLTRSEQFVDEYEQAEVEAGVGVGARTKGWRGRMAREEVERAGRRLEEGWARAREVLVVG